MAKFLPSVSEKTLACSEAAERTLASSLPSWCLYTTWGQSCSMELYSFWKWPTLGFTMFCTLDLSSPMIILKSPRHKKRETVKPLRNPPKHEEGEYNKSTELSSKTLFSNIMYGNVTHNNHLLRVKKLFKHLKAQKKKCSWRWVFLNVKMKCPHIVIWPLIKCCQPTCPHLHMDNKIIPAESNSNSYSLCNISVSTITKQIVQSSHFVSTSQWAEIFQFER